MNKQTSLRRWEHLRNTDEENFLILFNDDFNTFEHVIKSLVEICGHDSMQAEQCALIAHFNGSCEIRAGKHSILNTMKTRLNTKGLECEII
jgi:ATP-dependent Clp protease adapter protein ClpS